MKEKEAWRVNGFLGLLLFFILVIAGALILWKGIRFAMDEEVTMAVLGIVLGILIIFVGLFIATGLFIVQPNHGVVLTFFGKYIGSVREAGFYLSIPLSARKKVSLRVRNFNSAKLKVNDQQGNPIEIAAVIVFKVVDTAKALFDVDNYEEFVEIQSETAIRHIASLYPYDLFEEEGFSLRGNTDEIAAELGKDLQKRLAVAGVEVMEARLTHLAYATEIAGAMLQRQQAAAILAARQKIVEGAVGMVQMVIRQLEADGMVELDEERKAAMVNNLMVAIVSERGAQPVINAGTLY
ncbi:Band 7 protein [[Clostridium] ultunense Esp]|uniref:SPFH domain-containing protein n=1 Tax=Thermicanus aegyptius TaxID=94009 RepID=UPI0002B6F553|nr:SPFH domain-containing protein [Thermicanus aegyptius]CCQ97294.1 Band 7 protein [[Clostridium] ultunense Esp]